MSDRSWVNLNVASHPIPAQVVAVLDEFDVVGDVRATSAASADLNIDEAAIGTATVLADRIVSAWPEADFYITQAPRYENAGIHISYSPKAGMRTHYIDGEGAPYLYSEDLRELLDKYAYSPARLVVALTEIVDEHLGPKSTLGGGRWR